MDCRVSIFSHNMGATFMQQQGDCASYATGGSGDQGDLA
jgi:hypothetical protein